MPPSSVYVVLEMEPSGSLLVAKPDAQCHLTQKSRREHQEFEAILGLTVKA